MEEDTIAEIGLHSITVLMILTGYSVYIMEFKLPLLVGLGTMFPIWVKYLVQYTMYEIEDVSEISSEGRCSSNIK